MSTGVVGRIVTKKRRVERRGNNPWQNRQLPGDQRPAGGHGGCGLAVLKELSNEGVVKLRDAVALTKTEKGKIKVHQTKDDSIGKGFVKGG